MGLVRPALNLAVAAFLVGTMLLSGCTGHAAIATSCSAGARCPSSGPTHSGSSMGPTPTGGLQSPNGLNATMQLEGCTGGVGSIEVEPSAAQSVVPDDFTVRGLTPFTASFLYDALQCSRLVANGTVFTDAFLLSAQVTVTPKNHTWADNRLPRYAVETVVGAKEMVPALQGLRLSAVAAVFERSPQTTANGGYLDVWKVTAPSCTYSFAFATMGLPTSATSGQFAIWSGPKPFVRLNEDTHYQYDSLVNEAPFTATGSCSTHAATSGAGEPIANPIIQYNGTWTAPMGQLFS